MESVINQSHQNIEIIVVDDGSVVSPKEVLTPYLNQIKYISKENGGKSSALNEAIQHASGDFIWVFDDDDIALPLKIELQLKRFVLNPKLGLIHTRSINFSDENGEVQLVHDLSSSKGKLDFARLVAGCFIHGPTVLFRKECLDAVGGWDEELIRAQDYDFWLRVAFNYEMEYLPVPTVRYRLHQGLRGSSQRSVQNDRINVETFNYEQKILSKLYREVEINEIYPDAFATDNITPMLEAFIQRAVVFAHRNLLDEVKQDLRIVRDNSMSIGKPCFSATAISNIKILAKMSVDHKWSDQELANTTLELLKLIYIRD